MNVTFLIHLYITLVEQVIRKEIQSSAFSRSSSSLCIEWVVKTYVDAGQGNFSPPNSNLMCKEKPSGRAGRASTAGKLCLPAQQLAGFSCRLMRDPELPRCCASRDNQVMDSAHMSIHRQTQLYLFKQRKEQNYVVYLLEITVLDVIDSKRQIVHILS